MECKGREAGSYSSKYQARGGEPETTRGKLGFPGLAALGFLGNILTSLVIENGRTKEEEWVGWSYGAQRGQS